MEQEAPPAAVAEDTNFKTEVPKFRDNWNINTEALIDLNARFTGKGEAAYDDPEFITLQNQVREEFLTNNPVPGNLPRPDADSAAEHVFAWYDATTQLYREYFSDVYREKLVTNINESQGKITDAGMQREAEKAGLRLALFNGIADELGIRESSTLFMMRTDGTGDLPLPAVDRTFLDAELFIYYPGPVKVLEVSNDVTTEDFSTGLGTQSVMTQFEWNPETSYWTLTSETTLTNEWKG